MLMMNKVEILTSDLTKAMIIFTRACQNAMVKYKWKSLDWPIGGIVLNGLDPVVNEVGSELTIPRDPYTIRDKSEQLNREIIIDILCRDLI